MIRIFILLTIAYGAYAESILDLSVFHKYQGLDTRYFEIPDEEMIREHQVSSYFVQNIVPKDKHEEIDFLFHQSELLLNLNFKAKAVWGEIVQCAGDAETARFKYVSNQIDCGDKKSTSELLEKIKTFKTNVNNWLDTGFAINRKTNWQYLHIKYYQAPYIHPFLGQALLEFMAWGRIQTNKRNSKDLINQMMGYHKNDLVGMYRPFYIGCKRPNSMKCEEHKRQLHQMGKALFFMRSSSLYCHGFGLYPNISLFFWTMAMLTSVLPDFTHPLRSSGDEYFASLYLDRKKFGYGKRVLFYVGENPKIFNSGVEQVVELDGILSSNHLENNCWENVEGALSELKSTKTIINIVKYYADLFKNYIH